MPSYTRRLHASLLQSGRAATLAYRVVDLTGAELVPLTTGTMTEVGSTAEYSGEHEDWNSAWEGLIEWSDEGTLLYVERFAASMRGTDDALLAEDYTAPDLSGLSTFDPEADAVTLAPTGLDAIVPTEPAGVPAWGASVVSWLAWLGVLSRNEQRRTASTASVRNDAGTSNIATAPLSDDGETFVRGEWN